MKGWLFVCSLLVSACVLTSATSDKTSKPADNVNIEAAIKQWLRITDKNGMLAVVHLVPVLYVAVCVSQSEICANDMDSYMCVRPRAGAQLGYNWEGIAWKWATNITNENEKNEEAAGLAYQAWALATATAAAQHLQTGKG